MGQNVRSPVPCQNLRNPVPRGSEPEEPGSAAPQSEPERCVLLNQYLLNSESGGFHWICSRPPIYTGACWCVCVCLCVMSVCVCVPSPLCCKWMCVPSPLCCVVCVCSFTSVLWVCSFTPVLCVPLPLCCVLCVPSPLCCVVCVLGLGLGQLYSYSPSRTFPALVLCLNTSYIILPSHVLAMQRTASRRHHLLMQHCLVASCYMV